MAHGKASRKKNRDKQLAKKKARREANQAKYQALAAEGKNKKSKRHVLASRRKRATITKHRHLDGYCGNLACIRCFPINADGSKRVKGPSHEETKREKSPVVRLRGRRLQRGLGRLITLGRATPAQWRDHMMLGT